MSRKKLEEIDPKDFHPDEETNREFDGHQVKPEKSAGIEDHHDDHVDDHREDAPRVSRLEELLQRAEAAGRAQLAEHESAIAALFDNLDPDEKEFRINVLGWHGLLEHEESRRRKLSVKPPPCPYCERAERLLRYANEVRFDLANGAGEPAAVNALWVGALAVEIELGVQLGEDADLGRTFATGPKCPRRDLLNRALVALLDKTPDLTIEDVLTTWRSGPPDCVQEVEPDGTVTWYSRPGDEHTTSRQALEKRLQRLRRTRAHS